NWLARQCELSKFAGLELAEDNERYLIGHLSDSSATRPSARTSPDRTVFLTSSRKKGFGMKFRGFDVCKRSCCLRAFLLLSVGLLPSWERSEEHTSELQSRGQLVCR